MTKMKSLSILSLLFASIFCYGQQVQILGSSVNNFGQIELEIEGSEDEYYLLHTLHGPGFDYETVTSMTLGVDGPMIISEPMGAFNEINYRITAHSIADPDDTDGDGIDDVTEFNDRPHLSPLNAAFEVPFLDGSTSIDSRETFEELSVVNNNIGWAPFLNNQEYVKFVIIDFDTDEPKLWFINSKTHFIHNSFMATIESTTYMDNVMSGEIIYNPNTIHSNGAFGVYDFNYSFGYSFSFEETRRTFEILAASMPFLENNFRHFIGDAGESGYLGEHIDDYPGSRIEVVLESDVFAEVDYIPFHQAEGFGLFREMQVGENPGSRDIVLYDVLPNSLPRVGGIITSVVQTPLSHVNLRAIQDNVPNAYIREPLDIDSIRSLVGKYIYYKASAEKYEIRESSLEEVNEWYEQIRPTEEQIPERDLTQTEILPLDEIDFHMSNIFGAKCTNVATMRKFGFPEGTIPEGFGIPFYYYDEFMKYNDFYEQAQEILNDPDFLSDLETRIEMLDDFRKDIRDGSMPQWMLDDLQAMHDQFPEGTSVRCRSSTNNEDLPGFSGAGLYTSKTQHPEEGHISKSVKQVYASMWNFRAYDERDFYRVDHFSAAMGILCHNNFEDEKSNGVGISIDPLYQTQNNFYLNTQIGENLITNPEANSIPEEILLSQDPEGGYFVLRNSNLVPNDQLVMDEVYLDQMREYLQVIHDEFSILYGLEGIPGFGMDIEYKVTRQDQLIIKQARPWVSFWSSINAIKDLSTVDIVRPVSSSELTDTEYVVAEIRNAGLEELTNFEISLFLENELVETLSIEQSIAPQYSENFEFTIPIDLSEIGDYQTMIVVSHEEDGYALNDTLRKTVSNLFALEAAILNGQSVTTCGGGLELGFDILNLGNELLTSAEVQIFVNGVDMGIEELDFFIPYGEQRTFFVPVIGDFMENDNEVVINLISVNDSQDTRDDNNSIMFFGDINTEFESITFIVNPDMYPQETSWLFINQLTGQVESSGSLSSGDEFYSEDICVVLESCYTLIVNDSYGDGICCTFGQGNFQVLTQEGDTLIYNDGDFGSSASENFCISNNDCFLSANIQTTNATGSMTSDGTITITDVSNGEGPFVYSIDGENFQDEPLFEGLSAGSYTVTIVEVDSDCTYTEIVDVEFTSSLFDIEGRYINIYPNPTKGNVILALDESISSGPLELLIYDQLSRLIKSETIDSQRAMTEISLTEIPSGSYFIKCIGVDFEQVFKLQKM